MCVCVCLCVYVCDTCVWVFGNLDYLAEEAMYVCVVCVDLHVDLDEDLDVQYPQHNIRANFFKG